jgi:hypothetical protein
VCFDGAIEFFECGIHVAELTVEQGQLHGRNGLGMGGGEIQTEFDDAENSAGGVGLFDSGQDFGWGVVQSGVFEILGDVAIAIALLPPGAGEVLAGVRMARVESESLVGPFDGVVKAALIPVGHRDLQMDER